MLACVLGVRPPIRSLLHLFVLYVPRLYPNVSYVLTIQPAACVRWASTQVDYATPAVLNVSSVLRLQYVRNV